MREEGLTWRGERFIMDKRKKHIYLIRVSKNIVLYEEVIKEVISLKTLSYDSHKYYIKYFYI